jgi:hypothetical protein
MNMQQMLESLLVGQEQMMTDRIADREHMKQMMVRRDNNLREMREEIRFG